MKYPRLFIVLLAIAVLMLAACAGGQTPPEVSEDATATPASDVPAATAEIDAGQDSGEPETSDIPSWPDAPELTIDPSQLYVATFKTEKGDIVVELMADKAPQTVNNLVFLAEQGYYDNTTFHRVLPGFMAQGGDPTGTGSGGPGYTIPDEIDPELEFDRPGLLAMANPGLPDSNGSQFFITYDAAPWLNGAHTIFGEVIHGQDVLDALTPRDPETNPDFTGDILYTVEVSAVDASQRPTPTATPTPFAPDISADNHFMASMAMEERIDYWNSPPAMGLEDGTIYLAIFRTDIGDITVELLPDLAPNNVNNLVALARAGYYDGTHFFQVVEDLVAVGGDPLETGQGTPGYAIADELHTDVFNDVGWLGAAQSAPDSNGGQFFFTLTSAPWLSDRFSPLGRVIEGQDVLSSFEPLDPNADAGPGVLLQRLDIDTTNSSGLPEPTATPAPFSPTLPPEGERPLSELPPAERENYYNAAPELAIDVDQDYIAILRTDAGDITIDLFEQQTPMTVNNFVLLALNGFYDETTFHRVLEDFMAQGGDPTGTGAGGPGYVFDDEIVNELRHDREGIVSMANRGYNTNGSQFFITYVPTPWLDDRHTIFGEVIEGMDVLRELSLRDPDVDTEPGTTLLRVDIETR